MRIPKKYRLILLAATFMVLFSLSYGWICTPLAASIKEAKTELAAGKERLVKLSALPDHNADLNQQLDRLTLKQEKMTNRYFSLMHQQEEVIWLIQSFFREPLIEATSIAFTPPVIEMIEETPLSAMTVTIAYQGTYLSLMNLLERVWSFNHRILVNQLSINMTEEDTVTGHIQLVFYDISHLANETEPLFFWLDDHGGTLLPEENP